MARERDDDYEDDGDERPARKGTSGGGSGEPIQNYLVQSILVFLCCCWPLGIVALLSATKVNGLVASGDLAGAREASANAKKWSTYGAIGGAVVGVVVGLFYLVTGVLLAGAGAAK